MNTPAAYSWDMFWQDVGMVGFILAFAVGFAWVVAGLLENARQDQQMRDDQAEILRRLADEKPEDPA